MMSAAELPANDPRRTRQTLTDEDNRTINALHNLGMYRTAPAIVVAMTRYGMGASVNSRWLERVTDLRQPEVSLGLKYLVGQGLLICEEDLKKLSKGRPVRYYTFARNPLDFIQDLIDQRRRAFHDDAQAVYAAWQGMGA